MLELLGRYAAEHGLNPEAGFTTKQVRWALQFDRGGRFLGAVELGDAGAKRNRGREFPRSPDLTQRELISGGVTKSHFLAETVEVVALLLGPRSDRRKAEAKHTYFVKLLREAAEAATVVAEFGPVAATLADQSALRRIRQELERLKARPNEKITLQIGGKFPLEEESWCAWWRQYRKSLGGDRRAEAKNRTPAALMPSLMSGEMVEPARTHFKIAGLADVGGLATGDVLAGFDKAAFESYGLPQSANAPVSEQEVAAYRTALNDLIHNSSHRLVNAKVVHWFKSRVPPEDDPFPWFVETPEKTEQAARRRATDLLRSIEAGQRPDLAGNEYYAVTLSGAAGRVMVRDWMEGGFPELVRSVEAWFDDLTIVHRAGGRTSPAPKFLAVAGACVRELGEVPAEWIAALWRCAVRGRRIPDSLMAAALRRVRGDVIDDQPFNHARMGLLRAYHVRKARKEGDREMAEQMKPYLNPEHPSPAYQCGRLMAVLAALQRTALGDVGAGVVQRYYAAASTTPALVFGRLVRTAQFHLNKVESGGLAHWYEDRIAEISCRVKDKMPATLTLEEQSLFALGYYQQIAALRTKKANNDSEKGE